MKRIHMFIKKHLLMLIAVSFFTNLRSEEKVSNAQTKVVHVTRCKTIDFGVRIEQEAATQEEREAALQIITDFCNTHITTLTEELKTKAPHISINITLLNIEEDSSQSVGVNVEIDSENVETDSENNDNQTNDDTCTNTDSTEYPAYYE